jgi:hypothetical protein
MPCLAEAEEITLVKRAHRMEPAESFQYTVKPGDTLWKILVQTQDVRYDDFSYLYRKFRELNPEITDLDHIVTGQRIIVPHVSGHGEEFSVQAASEDVYVIKKGQHLAMILRQVYGLPDDLIFNEYLNLIQELNPEIDNLNLVEAGQKIRMPEVKEVVSAARRAKEAQPPEAKAADGGTGRPDQLLHELIEQKVYELTQQQKAAEKQAGTEQGKSELREIEQKPEAPAPVASILESSRKKRELPPEIEKENNPLPVAQAAPPVKMKASVKKKNVPEEMSAKAVSKQKPSGRGDRVPGERAAKKPDVFAEVDRSTGTDEREEGTGSAAHDGGPKNAGIPGIVKNILLPALTTMGGRQQDRGTYFMPMAGGSSVSIDTSEIPVMELDTGMRIILDVNSRISPEIKDILEQAFPACRIISGPPEGLEHLMDRVLNVAGYFSVNKDASPLLVGEEEKIRFFGKWIVYKDYSRQNVFVVNLLSDEEHQTPESIRKYASRFGIDLIEMGGRPGVSRETSGGSLTQLDHSYQKLLDLVGVDYERDRELELVSLDALRIVYKAPLLRNMIILAEEMPDKTMSELLTKRGYTVVHTKTETLEHVLDLLGIQKQGPPVKTVVAQNRTELELPAVQVGEVTILSSHLDADIARYLASRGMKIAIW